MVDRTVAYRMVLDSSGVVQGARNATAAMKKFGRDGVDAAQSKLTSLSGHMRTHQEDYSRAGTAVAAAGGVIAVGLGTAVKAAMSWESAWAGVTKTVDGTPAQMKRLQGELRGLSRVLPATHEEIAGVAEAAGQLGIKTGAVTAFTKTMIDMGQSTNLSADSAATSMARFMNIMGTSQSDVGKLGASIVGLGNNYATTESEIMDMAMRLAGAGKQAKMSEGDVLGFSTALSSVGIDAEAGGTALSLVMKKMGNEVANGGDKLDEFARVSGMSSDQFAAAWQKDSAGALATFVAGLGEAQTEGQNTNKILSDLGITGIRESDALIRLSNASDLLKNSLATGNQEYDKGSALALEAAKRYETSESKMRMAGNAIKDNAIDIGGVFLPVLKEASDGVAGLTKLFDGLPQPVKAVTGIIAGLTGGLALAGGGFMVFAPKVIEAYDALQRLRGSSKTVDKILTTMSGPTRAGKAMRGLSAGVGAAVAAYTALQVAGAVANAMAEKVPTTEKLTTSMLQLGDAGGVTKKSLDDLVKTTGSGGASISGFGDAINAVNMNGFMKGLDNVASLGIFDTTTGLATDAITRMDQALSSFATSGSTDKLNESFRAAADSAAKYKFDAGQVIDQMPELKAQMYDQAKAMGLSTDSATLAKIALGEIKPNADSAATGVKGVGDAATDTAKGLKDLLDGLLATGLATLSEREGMRQYQDAIDGLSESIKENGKSLDVTTEKGRNNQTAFDEIAKSGMAYAKTLGETGHSEQEIQKHLEGTYNDLVKGAKQFGLTGSKANAMAREVLGIPNEKSVKTWMSDAARQEAKKTKKALDGIKTDVTVKIKLVTDGNIKNMPEGLLSPDRHKVPQSSYSPYVSSKRNPLIDAKRGLLPRATGGSVLGEGTETSDSIPALLSNNEHVWTAKEVRGAGGHAAVENLRGLARRGELPAFKDGGRVGSAQKELTSLKNELTRARRRKQDAKTKAAKARATARIRALEDDIKAAQKTLESAKKDNEAAEERRKAETERRARVADLRTDLRQDIRRGDVRESVTGGLSSAYSTVDRLYDLGKNQDLTKNARNKATRDARNYETSLRSLYKSLDRVQKKTETAKAKLDELKQIQSSVASSISGNAYKLDTSELWAQDSKGRWSQTKGVSGARTNAAAAAKRVKDLASKLNRLQKMGYSGAILEEIATASSIDESTAMADALLQGKKSDVNSLNASYKDIEKYSQQAGKYVTGGFYKGGVDAAAGIVKGLESQEKAINATILRIAKGMETSLKKALGIKSPSTVMRARGRDTGKGYWMGIADEESNVTAASESLALAAVPDTPDVAVGGGSASSSLFSQSASPAASSLSSAPTAVTAAAPGDAAEAWDSMTTTSGDALDAMQAKTAASYAQMTVDTTDSLTAQSETVTTHLAAMSKTQSDTLTSMQQGHLTVLQQMGKDQSSNLELMKKSNASGYASMKSTATKSVDEMRKSINSTSKDLRDDYGTHLGSLKESNRVAMNAIESAGKNAFGGIRSGMNSQMREARPELGGKLNALIGLLGRFVGSVNTSFKDVGVKLTAPKALKFDTGGVMPGYTPGRDIHHFQSPTGGDLYLSGGEAIMRPEFTRAIGGEEGVKRLNMAARRGDYNSIDRELAHEFASGGVMPRIPGVTAFADSGVWRGLWSLVKGKFPGISLTSAYRPGSTTVSGNSSYHSRGMAIDISPSMPVFEWLRQNYGDSNEIIYSPANGRQIHNGSNHMYSGAVRAMHYNHIHWARRNVPGGATGAPMPFTEGGGAPVIPPFLEKAGFSSLTGDLQKLYVKAANKHVDAAVKPLAGQLGDLNPMMRALADGVLSQARTGLVAKAKDYAKQNTSSGVPGNIESWRDDVARALSFTGIGSGREDEDRWLRQVKSESDGNPKLVQSSALRDINVLRGDPARGLVQVPGVTWADFGGGMGSFIPNVYDGYKNLVVGMRAASSQHRNKHFHGQSGWRAVVGYGHGYANGTDSAIPGWKWAGEDGPELVKFHGGEKVIPSQKSIAIENQVLRSASTVSLAEDSVDQLRAAVSAQLTSADVAKALDGVQIGLVVDGQQMSAHIITTVDSAAQTARTNIARGSQMIGAR